MLRRFWMVLILKSIRLTNMGIGQIHSNYPCEQPKKEHTFLKNDYPRVVVFVGQQERPTIKKPFLMLARRELFLWDQKGCNTAQRLWQFMSRQNVFQEHLKQSFPSLLKHQHSPCRVRWLLQNASPAQALSERSTHSARCVAFDVCHALALQINSVLPSRMKQSPRTTIEPLFLKGIHGQAISTQAHSALRSCILKSSAFWILMVPFSCEGHCELVLLCNFWPWGSRQSSLLNLTSSLMKLSEHIEALRRSGTFWFKSGLGGGTAEVALKLGDETPSCSSPIFSCSSWCPSWLETPLCDVLDIGDSALVDLLLRLEFSADPPLGQVDSRMLVRHRFGSATECLKMKPLSVTMRDIRLSRKIPHLLGRCLSP